MSEFVKNLGVFSKDQVMAAECAGKAIVALAISAKEIPNEGGVWQSIIGEKSIASFGDKLPSVGSNLNKFISSLGSFGSQQLETVKCAGSAILSLAKAAKEIPNQDGLWQKIVGEQSIATFASKLPDVGSNISMFVKNLGTFTDVQVATTDCAGRAIVALGKASANIPAEGSIWEGLVGKQSLANFSSKLPEVANKLAEFVKNLGTFTDAQVATTDCAGRAIVALGKASANIPAEDGLWQKIVGEKSIAAFGSKLPDVGTNLGQFVKNLGTFTTAQVSTVGCAANAIAEFAKAGANIPNSGGLVSLFTGDNDIRDFASKLPTVGLALGLFIKNIGTFGKDQIATTNAATEAMKALANFGSVDTSKVNDVLYIISGHLAHFGTNLALFTAGLNAVSTDDLKNAITKMNQIIEMSKSISDIPVDSLKTFGESLKNMGIDSMNKFIEAFSGQEPKAKAVRGIKDIISAMLTGLESKRAELVDKYSSLFNSMILALQTPTYLGKIESLGKYFAEGFANGIINNKYLATDAGTKLGNSAYEGARKAIDAHSPSKKAFELGGFFGIGFANGLVQYGERVYKQSYNLGTNASDGLQKGIGSMYSIIDSSMNNNPVVRPVLDLTDIKEGSKSISGMFDNPNLNTNLNAISNGMRNRQNGTNDDVVSAIDKLRSNLNGGNTYNINGVTYGDTDTAINKAVGILIRAANVERRI